MAENSTMSADQKYCPWWKKRPKIFPRLYKTHVICFVQPMHYFVLMVRQKTPTHLLIVSRRLPVINLKVAIISQVVISYGDWCGSDISLSAVADYECKSFPCSLSLSLSHLLSPSSPSHGNSLVLLFESSCTIWDVIYSDSLNIIAEAWEDKWFDEAMYLLSDSIIGWMCGPKL